MKNYNRMVSALVAASLASEDVFLNWAKEQGRQYHTRAEITKRRAIFMKNYNRMVEHNKEFAAGRVSWARGINQWYDLTEEEWMAELGLGRFSPWSEGFHLGQKVFMLVRTQVPQFFTFFGETFN